jgi:hypothetical protein
MDELKFLDRGVEAARRTGTTCRAGMLARRAMAERISGLSVLADIFEIVLVEWYDSL